MSHYIPFELQEEIIKRLPVRSLIQYRAVSRAWKTLIDSSDFILDHSLRHTQPEHLLVSYKNLSTYRMNYMSFVDDETFPRQKSVFSVPLVVEGLANLITVGSSHGLLCFYGVHLEPGHVPCYKFRQEMAVLWNPSIRKSISVFVPKVLYKPYNTVLGFGVCPVNRDPKMVKISFSYKNRRMVIKPWKVEVYTLSLGEWRSLSSNLPRSSIEITWSQVAIDRFIYWLAYDRIFIDDGVRSSNLILSFDMINENFGVMDLPDILVPHTVLPISVSKLRESLALLQCCSNTANLFYDVWVIDHGVQRSFTKLFTVEAPHASIRNILGFRKSGEPIIETKYHDERPIVSTALGFYEPTPKRINDLEIDGIENKFLVNSYVETLLLLNR